MVQVYNGECVNTPEAVVVAGSNQDVSTVVKAATVYTYLSASKIQQIKLTMENQTSNMLKPERLVPVCGGARGGAECAERGPLLQLHQQQGEATSDRCQCSVTVPP